MAGSQPGVATAVACLIFSLLVALVMTGALIPDPRLAAASRRRWWYISPAVTALAALIAAVVLPVLLARVLCLLSIAIAVSCLQLGPKVADREPSGFRGRRAAPDKDRHQAVRIALLAAAIALQGIATYISF